jgi:hypothetical protein
MTIWNQIVNAVYRNEWPRVEAAVRDHPTVQLDDANCMADVMGNIVAGRLRSCETGGLAAGVCLQETVTWLLRQPYINRERFAEWVAMDALKADTPVHRRTFQQVAPHCRAERLREIERHLAECAEDRARAKQAISDTLDLAQAVTRPPWMTPFLLSRLKEIQARRKCAVTLDPAREVKTGGVFQLAMNDAPAPPVERTEVDGRENQIHSWGGCTTQ